MTKQLNRVTLRAGAGAGQNAPGRQEAVTGQRLGEGERAWRGVCPALRPAAAASATRAQLSATSRSTGVPSGALSRYFMSQIWRERSFMASARMPVEAWPRSSMLGITPSICSL